MPGILEGLKVIDMGQVVAIPAAGAMMADWGAEVIKLEPLTGEFYRGLVRIQGVGLGEVKWNIQVLNRNKRGLALNLKTDAGRDILYKLIRTADVFMSNYKLDSINRFKIDYATLSQINPKIIYCFLSGYGMKGPEKDERGFDFSAAWARSGMMYLIGEPLPKQDRTKAGNPIWNSYRTKDDRWFWLAMLQGDAYWPDFCKAIERPELEKDPQFESIEMRTRNCEELIRTLDEVLASRTMEEWEKRFKEHNCIVGRVASLEEVINDPQALVNDFFAEVEDYPAEKVKLVATPVNFHQNPGSVRAPAPEVGQNTEEILLELGYTWEDIASLKEQGVIL
ncbi:CaiB/BaiF CoA transferase family protein [Chloroflexota bacterium]